MSRFKVMKRRQAGFSLLELMIVLLVMSIMMGAIFQQIGLVQQRASAEATKLDIFQESREFMDQMGRDLKQAGYPNGRNYVSTAFTVAGHPELSGPNHQNNAVGLVKVGVGELQFEADVDGTGQVSTIHYYLDTTGTNCPCLKRSQMPKIPGDPVTGQSLPLYWTEVQNVQNGTTANPIFTAYDPNGAPLALPADIDNQGDIVGKIKSIQVLLTVQSPVADLKTGVKPIINLTQTIKLNNCSAAQTCVMQSGVLVCAPGGDAAMSCSQ